MPNKNNVNDVIQLVSVNVDEPVRNLLLSFLRHPDVYSRLAAAPASTAVRYHHAYEGGLVDHIIETYAMASKIAEALTPWTNGNPVTRSDIAIVAVLHDIHKIGDACGVPNYEANILKSGKRSEAEPFAKSASHYRWVGIHQASTTPEVVQRLREMHFLLCGGGGHIAGGVRSLALIWAYAPELYRVMSKNQKFSIQYHDGAYQSGARYAMGGKETALQIAFHAADMASSRLSRPQDLENLPVIEMP